MSSVASPTTAQLSASRWSAQNAPQTRMSDTISRELSAGTISSTDATALTSALSAIDSNLSPDRTGATSSSGGTIQAQLDPSSLKDRLDNLISGQVSSGALTGDQATELKTLFSSHGQSTQTSDAASGAGGPLPGLPPGPPPNDAAAGRATEGTSSGSSGSMSTNDLLSTFIQQIQSSQSVSPGYGASATSTGTNIPALLFDFRS